MAGRLENYTNSGAWPASDVAMLDRSSTLRLYESPEQAKFVERHYKSPRVFPEIINSDLPNTYWNREIFTGTRFHPISEYSRSRKRILPSSSFSELDSATAGLQSQGASKSSYGYLRIVYLKFNWCRSSQLNFVPLGFYI